MWKSCNLVIFFSLITLSSSLLPNQNTANPSIASLQLNDDILGLIVFKSDLHDPQSHLQSWNEDDSTPCSWQFIKCDPSTGKVTHLSLDNLSLSGKVGRGLQKLQSLKQLSLSSNNLTGNLAGAVPNSLQSLNLSRNGFSGIIPDSLLSNMGSLKFLDLSENSFTGVISSDFFTNCPPLRFMSLAGNALAGSVPISLKECWTLNSLNLSRNHFSGNPEFVSGIWSLSRLRLLDLSENDLSGEIPLGVSFIHNLKELHLQGNQFSGTIPADIGFCPHLTVLNLSYNLLTGDFPQWVGNLGSLHYLDLSNNGFVGVLPVNIGDLKLLSYLSISSNRISGGIPVSLVYSDQLRVLKLRDNLLNGSIPKGLFNLGLNEIDLSGNLLSGEIPAPGSNRLLESLRRLDLSRNKLSGNIPAEIGLCSKVSYLNFSWNGEIRSRIPPELGFFRNLTVLDLRNNGLYGLIPGDICDSGSLQVIQLDGNSLTGPIPQEIGDNCSSLSLLTLSNNNLNGHIPKSLGMLRKLKILKLEFNHLTGEIPPELGNLENLLAVNISYNQLIGRLPTNNLFQNIDQSALQGNLGICSPLLKGPCKMNVSKPLVLDPNAFGPPHDHSNHRNRQTGSQNPDHQNRFFSVSAIVAISASLLIMVGVAVVTLLNMSARRHQTFLLNGNALEGSCSGGSTFHSGSSPSPATGKLVLLNPISSNGDMMMMTSPGTNTNLLNKATEIGSGTFGNIYKAAFGSSEVAIKKLVTSSITPYQEEFDRHVRILAKAVHPNLVTLRGYYWTPEVQLLVSDFIPNGTLQVALHESVCPLSWTDRLGVLLGVARGLAHLHHSFRPPIIHYNVKPSNILLDNNMNPKISDFGLVKLLNKHVSARGYQSTVGYFAPEMACKSLRVTEKCDVYSFGVMVLEVTTGRKPVEYGEDNVVILTENVKVMLERGNLLECVDSDMVEYPEDEVLPVLKLALVCTSQIPSSRPSMAEVVQILQVIKTPVPNRMHVT